MRWTFFFSIEQGKHISIYSIFDFFTKFSALGKSTLRDRLHNPKLCIFNQIHMSPLHTYT